MFVQFFFSGVGGKPPRQTLLKYENKIAKVNLGCCCPKKVSVREFSWSQFRAARIQADHTKGKQFDLF